MKEEEVYHFAKRAGAVQYEKLFNTALGYLVSRAYESSIQALRDAYEEAEKEDE